MVPGLNILYEDNHIIIINKSNNDLVQGDHTGDVSLDKRVKDYIRVKYNKPGSVFLGVVHRLDRPVSGAVIFARTSKALSRLNQLFRDGKINKEYLAIVKNQPPESEALLVHYMKKNARQNKSYCYSVEKKDTKQAKLSYQIIDRSDNYFLLGITLFTGRHHQIRSQLQTINCPIKGDLKYGYPRSNPDGGISLHAYKINFIHPVKNEPIYILAEPPENEPLWKKFKFPANI